MQLFSTDPRHPGFFAVGQEAVGFIALGQAALGVIAIGQIARGVFCLGQGAIGVFCVGQGSIGLVHGTGMLALAGNSGYGLALHLLPRLVTEPLPALPSVVPIADVASRALADGWVEARLSKGRDGAPVVTAEGNARIDTSAIAGELVAAVARGDDRAAVHLRAEVVVDDTSYRSTETHTELVADRFVSYSSHRPRHLAYAVPPKGAVGERASAASLALRTLAWLVAVGVVTLAAFLPLASALVGAR